MRTMIAIAFCAAIGLAHAAPQPQGEGVVVGNPHQSFFDRYEGTSTCLQCHEKEATHVFGSIHYQWKAEAGGEKLGKINSTNDFCTNPSIQWISILQNAEGKVIGNGCSKCHAGLGAKPSETMSRAQLENIDCLLCHAPGYKREVVKKEDGSLAWVPAARANADLMASIARNVSKPTNLNCLACHVGSGGGLNFKRGDLETAHLAPARDFDVHMGSGVQCIQCHRFREHRIEGVGTQMAGADRAERPACEGCHAAAPHASAALNRHTRSVACATCHIPRFAKKDPTDMRRDWSHAEEVKGQGRFEPAIEFAKDVRPVYAWWNGKGEVARLDRPVTLANGKVTMYRPLGSIADPMAKIAPFKYHTGRLPIEKATGLMIPVQVGATFRTGDTMASALGGAKAYRGKELSASDIAYVEVDRWMGIFHEVVPKAQALQCNDCHGAKAGRMDWKALGYGADPQKTGGRRLQ